MTVGNESGSMKWPLFEVILSVITTFFKFCFVLLIRTPQAAWSETVGDFAHLPITSTVERALSGFTTIGLGPGVRSSRLLTPTFTLIVWLSPTLFLLIFKSKCKCPLNLYFPVAFSLNTTCTLPPPPVAVAAFVWIVAVPTTIPSSPLISNVVG